MKLLLPVALTAIVWSAPSVGASQTADQSSPVTLARVLAEKYPAQPIMSYIPALSWSGQLRLAALTGEPKLA